MPTCTSTNFQNSPPGLYKGGLRLPNADMQLALICTYAALAWRQDGIPLSGA